MSSPLLPPSFLTPFHLVSIVNFTQMPTMGHVARVKHHQKQHAPYRRPSRLRGRPDDDDMTFVSSQGCTAVSIDTRTALARFWSHTHARVGVPAGFCETRTRTRRNPYPCVRVRVFWGTGAGSPGKPQGYPCQSLGDLQSSEKPVSWRASCLLVHRVRHDLQGYNTLNLTRARLHQSVAIWDPMWRCQCLANVHCSDLLKPICLFLSLRIWCLAGGSMSWRSTLMSQVGGRTSLNFCLT